MDNQIEIIRGEDRTAFLKVAFRNTRDPFSLEGWVRVEVHFKKSDNTTLIKSTDTVTALFASVTYNTYTFTAVTGGVIGNAIALVFDGVADIDTVVNAWNTANPTNTVSHDAVGTEVPVAGTATLTGGVDAFSYVEVVDARLGKLSVRLDDVDTNSLRVGPNQSILSIVDKNSAHPSGERRKIMFDNVLTVKADTF